MRVLTELELKEFQKTYDFLNYYIGSAASKAKKIQEIKFDGSVVNSEIIKFVNGFRNIFRIEELGMTFKSTHTELQKINLMFNETTKEHKNAVMDRLIKYCFNNKVQPHRLRMRGWKAYQVIKDETPVIVEYGTAA
ncbi:hypothetical protein CPG37_04500 [Malaciobacter canalis]|uniref:Uncharacterized protein n=1 Tax=Malaciobacter canalis TaxID=1912871 RepID=A0ABX4LQU2_9BACT|nr:hypothetical protein [Malaciobacter canalis]PHO10312.1 hypothetical protein CPG37_04500 [Malaciobacter canalis]QEE32417.1 hypothetical protein ACAN_0928 [Malaciobacter canalis]